jgi:hypothetical protein
MKVAILISGQPRNFEKGYLELKKSYLDRYDCDIFFHTWRDNNFKATQFFNDRPVMEYNMEPRWVDDIVELYKPVTYLFESPIIFDKNNIKDPMWRTSLQNCKSMWYSIQKAFELVPTGYDAYIRTRFDLMYEESLLDLESLDFTKVHTWAWENDPRVTHRGYYDIFGIGSYDTMGIYSQVFSKIDWYLNYDEEYKKFLSGGWPGQDSGLRTEYLLRWHLTTSGIKVVEHKAVRPQPEGQIIR